MEKSRNGRQIPSRGLLRKYRLEAGNQTCPFRDIGAQGITEGTCHSDPNLDDAKSPSSDEQFGKIEMEGCNAEEAYFKDTGTEHEVKESEVYPTSDMLLRNPKKMKSKDSLPTTKRPFHGKTTLKKQKLESFFGYEEKKLELQKTKWNSTRTCLFSKTQNSDFTNRLRYLFLISPDHRQCNQRQYFIDRPLQVAKSKDLKCEGISIFSAHCTLNFKNVLKNLKEIVASSLQSLSVENINVLWINVPSMKSSCADLELKCISNNVNKELNILILHRYNEKNPWCKDTRVIHDDGGDVRTLKHAFIEEAESDKNSQPPIPVGQERSTLTPTSDRPNTSRNGYTNRLNRPLRQLESDTRVADKVADPPGQQSVYVLPGNTLREDYRLSTFEKFPVTCPISRKVLANSGFFYTGFVDRVKCFACGRTVERWEATDNPAELRWHKPTCPFPRREECGNVPIMNAFHVGQGDEVIVQRAPASGQLNRIMTCPAGMPQNIRQSGGIFDVGPNNHVTITTGRPAHSPSTFGNQSNIHQPSRPWRLGNVISSDKRRFLTNLYKERELDRLASFAQWPMSRPIISPVHLAKNGFIYLGHLDRTQCFSCGGELCRWTANDDAAAEHRKHFPNCRMVNGVETANLPIPTYPETQQEKNTNYPCRYATNPHMRSEAVRLETFDFRWQNEIISATPEQIAEAGFFFLGDRDRVKCWYCNGGLQNLKYNDVPWEEHAKWFPNCQFLLKMKGQNFVYNVLRANPGLPRPIIARQRGSPLDPNREEPPEDIPPSRNQAPVAPTIIDPREQMRKRKKTVKRVMKNSEVVSTVLKMGFDENIVAALIEDRLAADNEGNPEDVYESASDLLDDVMKREEEIRKEESERREAALEVTTAGPGSLATVSSIYSSMPNTSMMSSIGPSPGSGKYNVSFYGDDDGNKELELYGSTSGAVTLLKLPKGAEANTQSIQAAMNQIEEERMCKICFTNPADMLFVPCSHMCCCMDCTQAINKCLLCRKEIDQAIKTYAN